MKIPYRIVFLCLFTNGVQAQETNNAITNRTSNEFSISAGLNQGYIKDINFSPLNYTIGGQSYELTYTRKKTDGNSIFRTSLEFNNSELKSTKLTTYPKFQYLTGNLKVSYLKKVGKPFKKPVLFVGGQYQTNTNYIDFLDGEAFSFLITHSIDLSLVVGYKFNEKHSLSSSLSLPLITYMVRPPFAGFDEELDENKNKPFRLFTNGYFTSINKYIAPIWSLQYKYHFSNQFEFLTEYRMNYQKLFDNHQFTALQNQFKFGINYKF